MSGMSLRLRLALAGAAAVIVALSLAGLGLTALFGTHVQRRAEAEMAVQLDQVLAGLARQGQALRLITPPADPRFRRPYGGLYWQIETTDQTLRSRSLWDAALDLPADELADGQVHSHEIAGPDDTTLLALERIVELPASLGGGAARATVAMDAAELSAARRAFAADLSPYLLLLALILIAAQGAQLVFGLRPLGRIGARVAALRDGGVRRMGGDWPREMRPLAGEIDALLEARQADVERARARAGDLAHGLKTPLQALLGEAGRLRARGEDQAASAIEEVASAMQTHVDRELIRARAAARAAQAAAPVAEMVARIASVLRRTPNGERLDWAIDAPAELAVALDPADLSEALGALAENAARHAASRVAMTARKSNGRVRIEIRDDGPGIPDDALASIAGRGRRLDEDRHGAGLGLSIAAEIATAAGGTLSLENGLPGLRAVLELPAAANG